MFKEFIHILRTYFISFRYLKKNNIHFIKNLLSWVLVLFFLGFFL